MFVPPGTLPPCQFGPVFQSPPEEAVQTIVPGGGVGFDCVCWIGSDVGIWVVVVAMTTSVMTVGVVSPGIEILKVNGPGLPSGGWNTCGTSMSGNVGLPEFGVVVWLAL